MPTKKDTIKQAAGIIDQSELSPREILAGLYSHYLTGIRLFDHRKPARAKHYLAFIRKFPCIICESPIVEAHHHGRHAMGEKTDDYRTIPMCHKHHMHYHSQGFTGDLGGWSDADLAQLMIQYLVLYLRGVEGT